MMNLTNREIKNKLRSMGLFERESFTRKKGEFEMPSKVEVLRVPNGWIINGVFVHYCYEHDPEIDADYMDDVE